MYTFKPVYFKFALILPLLNGCALINALKEPITQPSSQASAAKSSEAEKIAELQKQLRDLLNQPADPAPQPQVSQAPLPKASLVPALPMATNKVVNISIGLSDGTSLDNKTLALVLGKTQQLAGTVTLEDGSRNSNIQWSSEDETIAKIDSEGRLTLLKAGVVTISAVYVRDAKFTARQVVSVVSAEQLKTLNFAGKVYDETGQLLSGAEVRAFSSDINYDQTVLTQEGLFVFKNAPVGQKLILQASKSGYRSQSRELVLEQEALTNIEYNFRDALALVKGDVSPSALPSSNILSTPLPETPPVPSPLSSATNTPTPITPTPTPVLYGSVTGLVLNSETGSGEVGVTVSIGGQTGTTDNNGRYTITNLTAGQKTLSVSKSGFAAQTVNVGIVTGSAATAATVTLQKQHWFLQLSGSSATLYDVDFINTTTGWVAGSGGTLLKTSNGGESWNFVSVPNQDFRGVDFLDANNGYLIANSGKVYKTTDGGLNWTEKVLNSSCVVSKLQFIDNNVGYANCSSRIYRTNNAGQTWTQYFYSSYSNYLSFHFWDANKGAIEYEGNFALTSNGGSNWQTISGSPPISRSMQFLDANTLVGISSIANVFLKSTDGGLTWTEKTFADNSFYAILMRFANASQGWAINGGVPSKILSTSDGGNTWLPNTVSYTGNFFPNDMHFVNAQTGWAVGNNGVILKY
jgi:photosystem II stability/assembly factor-like uncharacterized protein